MAFEQRGGDGERDTVILLWRLYLLIEPIFLLGHEDTSLIIIYQYIYNIRLGVM